MTIVPFGSEALRLGGINTRCRDNTDEQRREGIREVKAA